ncbi:NirA family protein [Enhydrobacter sp.]|jgi:ferredoxin-nitrite reductase|uniref:NirA family protein n=1 Tax=Enhydrobacter sp. TaxID=1894999 RepID=UPI00261E20A5|nr:NirA family protein [Enhydrobacter sp.]WIM09941.1 MAG: Ferredoxin--nitrite reductase [Enhydrobacter sp.]
MPGQKRYLEGFASGLQAARSGARTPASAAVAPPSGPDAAHLAAMARFEAEGKKLADPEKWKREEHPFDGYARLRDQASRNEYPKPADNFRWRFYGLFYLAPNQPFYMARLRMPNGILNWRQLAGIAGIAETWGAGYAHVTTRANIQIRGIEAKNATHVVEAVQDLGLTSRGSGADNIRNVTGDATAGIAPDELLDTRPDTRHWHFHVLNDRSLTGLPRKFNVAFDGGGPIPTLEETNDIGFTAVRVAEGASVAPAIWYRLALGGITGHRNLARPTDVVVPPHDSTKVADAVVRVFIDHGDRTNRARARLKYLIDAWGPEKFLAAVEEKLGRKLDRVEERHILPRPAQDRMAHIGFHAQKQPGLFYAGIPLPVGRLEPAQMRALAEAAHELGDGDLRLTVWQNLLVSGIAETNRRTFEQRMAAAGLPLAVSPLRAGLVACTGSSGCKLANARTKEMAVAIAEHCEPRVALDTPINVHLTGCPNSCAQHYVGDIGLVGARVATGKDETVDGYHVVIGGSYGSDARVGREFTRGIAAVDMPRFIERLLTAYLAHRAGPEETFRQFASRHDDETLHRLVGV